MSKTLIEMQARQQIHERITQASALRIASGRRRHQVAEQLRRVADRVDS